MDSKLKEKNTNLENFDRINYKEDELEKVMGSHYNNTMNHKMKDKDTSNKINPTNGLWPNSVLYTTTNDRMKASAFFDPYIKQEFNIKRNPFKTWEEEVQKFKNMGKKNKVEEDLKSKEKETKK
jgi:hypothetical protein